MGALPSVGRGLPGGMKEEVRGGKERMGRCLPKCSSLLALGGDLGMFTLTYSLNRTFVLCAFFYVIFHSERTNATLFKLIWFHFYILVLEHR